MSHPFQDFHSFGYDGHAVLTEVVKASAYGSLEQAVAALAVFAHPETVAQIMGRNTFRVIRGTIDRRGKYTDTPSGRVMYDDNKAPTDAFCWPHQLKSKHCRDVQFNHVWSAASDVRVYTSLANLCMLPAFLSKLTDTDEQIRRLLQYRAFDQFGFVHPGKAAPTKPSIYDNLVWASPLPVVPNLQEAYRNVMKNKPKDRTVQSARDLGWFFSDCSPDAGL